MDMSMRMPGANPSARSQGVGGYTFVNSEASDLVARFTTPPTNARKALIDTLVGSLKTGGIWSKLDALYVLAAADSQAARRNWIADAYNLTAVSGPTFSADRGYAGDGATSYLDTGLAPSAAVKYTLNDGSMGAWDRSERAGAAMTAIGCGSTGTGASHLQPRTTSNNIKYYLNATLTSDAAVSASAGMSSASRTGAASNIAYRNGSQVGTSVIAAAALSTAAFALLARQVSGASRVEFMTDQLAAGFVGSSLSAGEHLATYNALNTYLTAIGAG